MTDCEREIYRKYIQASHLLGQIAGRLFALRADNDANSCLNDLDRLIDFVKDEVNKLYYNDEGCPYEHE